MVIVVSVVAGFAGRLPQDILRDEPLPMLPNHPFRADRGTFQHTLVRLPAVRSPWLRTILEKTRPVRG
ncbi:hypothetical protein ACFV6E_07390 [Streptomyces sp. NPDC059785]|uniref:hypothetical protein n=1 Tax=unclassified Streptomyces TaxID=2593676 RepID=UPI00364A41B0